jgi:hypothetical protein
MVPLQDGVKDKPLGHADSQIFSTPNNFFLLVTIENEKDEKTVHSRSCEIIAGRSCDGREHILSSVEEND